MAQNNKSCRLCDSLEFSDLVDFGKIALGNDLKTNLNDALRSKKFPLKVIRCKSCNHFQLSFGVDPKKLFATNYTYLSNVGLSFTMC